MNKFKSFFYFTVLSVILTFAFMSFGCPQDVPGVGGQQGGAEGDAGKIASFTATEFTGEMTGEGIWVLDSRLSWKPYKGAAYYDVYIDGTKTNDEDVKTTKFRTAFDGNVDVDEKMGDAPKLVTIEVRACASDKKVIARAELKKMIPARPSFKDVKINGEPYQYNMKVKNPVSITVTLNNGIKFIGENKAKAVQNLGLYVEIAKYDDPVPAVYDFDETTGIMTIAPLGALKGSASYDVGGYKLKLKKGFPDKNKLAYTPDQDKDFSFKIEKLTSSTPLTVEKILINEDSANDLMINSSVTGVKAKGSSVSVLFNQLIDVGTYTKSSQSEGGTKGSGIYITESASGKGTDDSRLVNPVFERVLDGGTYKTKAVFEMVGKAFLVTAPEALKGNTLYYIVIDDDIKSGGNTSVASEVRKSFTTGEAEKTLYTLTVYRGTIQGKTETEISLAEGDEFTIVAQDPPPGKTFVGWYVGEYYTPELTAEQKMSKTLTLRMKGYDTTFSADFR
ncbi:MAG: hypothetical protein ACTTHG_01825 [Treponemataceae bacterium]